MKVVQLTCNHQALVRFRQEALEILRYSIMVVQWILVPLVEVRILIPQQNRTDRLSVLELI